MTPQVLLCGYLSPSAWGQGFGKCRLYWADLKHWVTVAGLQRKTRHPLLVTGVIAALCTGTATAHDGPEFHKPGEIPLVNNGPGPQVVYDELDHGQSNNTEPDEFKATSTISTSLPVKEPPATQEPELLPTEPLPTEPPSEPLSTKNREPEPQKESIAKSFWPWNNNNNKPPPEFKPYRLPTMEGDSRSYHDNLPPLVKAPAIDPDLVFNSVMTCYPAPSNFNIDVELRGQLRSAAGGDDLFETTDIGSNYVGIVARMPIYSHTEIDRERDREFNRRTVTAASVAQFVAAVATRNHAIRELALHRSLEARAAIRVQQGIVGASEQVTYLEKVASGQRALIQAEAEIMESRLAMAALCDPAKQDRMSQYLRHVSAVPKRAPAAK